MVNYENAKIYKLVCNKTGLVYVGSTCQRLLCKRLSGHVANYKRWKNGKTNNYVTSYTIIEGNDYYMELLEAVSCNGFDDLAKKERHYVESIDCVNKYIPGRTPKEYKQEWGQNNKEKIKEQRQEWMQDNKDYMKEYYKNNKEKLLVKVKCHKCGSVVTKNSLSRHQRSLKCQNKVDVLLEINELN